MKAYSIMLFRETKQNAHVGALYFEYIRTLLFSATNIIMRRVVFYGNKFPPNHLPPIEGFPPEFPDFVKG